MKLLDFLFGCWHRNMSFPVTSDRKKGPYVVCLTCGREFTYDWHRMKVGAEIPQEVLKTIEI